MPREKLPPTSASKPPRQLPKKADTVELPARLQPAESTSVATTPDVISTKTAVNIATVAIGRYLGLSLSQISSLSGLSSNIVSLTVESYPTLVSTLIDVATQLKKPTISHEPVRPISSKDIRSELEKDLGPAWKVLQDAIMEGNVDIAKWQVEQIIGKPTNKTVLTGKTEHLHEHVWRPERALIQEERDMIESDRLLKQLPGEVLEVEVLAVNGESVRERVNGDNVVDSISD